MAVQDVESALRAFLEVQTCRAQLYTRFQDGFKGFLRTKHEGHYKALMADLTAAFSECSKRVIALEGALKDMGRTDLAATLRSVQESERDKLRLTLTLQALKQAAAFRTFSWQQRKPQQGGASGSGSGSGGEVLEEDEDALLALLDPHWAAEAARGGCAHGHGHGCGHSHGNGHAEAAPAAAGGGAGSAAAEQAAGACGDAQASAGPCGRASCAAVANGGAQVGGSCGAAPGGDCGGGGDGGSSGFGGGGGGSTNGGGGGGTAAAVAAGGAPEPTRREFEAAVKEAMQELDACIRRINEAIGDVRIELEDS
ncbi:hypothetical protein PLESTB_000063400 [Pleodorina starrii]|uniref:Uncharacterized protein n=1 Tax=Pleodorina starrii TaxID=330485 RepID=A0A9W6B9Q7_9CHLO|nr:hypothetical protein PLESTM_001610100 [Pleodorina starrii]GLC48137.1 hypothetical protein PLESTB_000063400 [Pleodorina starrii]GLC67384.1 hypothetical protein PLESTF_000550500 [Pleodorina starrii]